MAELTLEEIRRLVETVITAVPPWQARTRFEAAPFVYVPSETQTLTASTAILANSGIVRINSAGNVTLTAAPTIADGERDQILIIVNVDSTDTITLQDQDTLANSNLQLQLSTRALAPRDVLLLIFDDALGDWIEVGFSGTGSSAHAQAHGNADHTAAPTPAQIDVGDSATVGTDAGPARGDHQHAFPAPGAGYPIDTDFNAEADGVATTPARSDHRHNIPSPAAPANVTKATADAGTATSPSRADHKHDVSTASASAGVDIGDAASEGTATSLTRSDHQHAVTAPGASYPVDVAATEADGVATTPARSDHQHAHGSGYLTDAHHAQAHGNADHTAAPTPSQIDVGDTATTGTDAGPSRGDHQHALPAPTTGYPIDTDFSAEADGVATTVARADHRHAIPAPAAPADVTKATAAAGTATSPSRADHKHDTSTGAAGASAVGDTAAEGTATSLGRSDHRHSRESFGAAGYPVDVAATEADGVATTLPRSDHQHAHGSGYLPDAHHSSANDHAQDHNILASADHDADNSTPVRGDLLRRGTSLWERLVAVTAGALVGGNGTDVVATVPNRTLVLTAAGGAPTTTAGCAEQTKVEISAQHDVWVLDFDQTTKEYAFWEVVMPDNYDGGTITAEFYWITAGGDNTHNVRWGLQFVVFNDGTLRTAALGTAQEVTDDATLIVNTERRSAATSAITGGGSPAGGRSALFVVYRDPAHVDDTLPADARLHAIKVEYTTNAISD